MFIEGFRLGLLLQLAVGPVCLMVFNAAGNFGFRSALLAVLAVTLVDAFYIFLASMGLSILLRASKVKAAVKLLGGAVLFLFGLDIIFGALEIPFLPQIKLFDTSGTSNVFLRALLLTASNPLSIVFWGGLFSTKVIEKNMDTKQLLLFGLGCISATFIFLNAIALAGSMMKVFLPKTALTFLNILVGMLLIVFALKMADFRACLKH